MNLKKYACKAIGHILFELIFCQIRIRLKFLIMKNDRFYIETVCLSKHLIPLLKSAHRSKRVIFN